MQSDSINSKDYLESKMSTLHTSNEGLRNPEGMLIIINNTVEQFLILRNYFPGSQPSASLRRSHGEATVQSVQPGVRGGAGEGLVSPHGWQPEPLRNRRERKPLLLSSKF